MVSALNQLPTDFGMRKLLTEKYLRFVGTPPLKYEKKRQKSTVGKQKIKMQRKTPNKLPLNAKQMTGNKYESHKVRQADVVDPSSAPL